MRFPLSRTRPLGLALCLALGASDARAQDGDQGPLPPALRGEGARADVLAVDGEPATPGRIPGGTSDAASELWARLLASTRTDGPAPAPIRSFDVTFDATVRSQGEPGEPSNDVRARFEFLDEGPGYVSGTYERSGRRTLRGPDGDYLVDKGVVTKLEGREDRESRRELERWLAVARTFAALTRPEGVRLVELRALELLPAPPAEAEPLTLRTLEFTGGRFLRLPYAEASLDRIGQVALLERARQLAWLEVASPDFQLFEERGRRPAGARVYRGLFGMDPTTGRVELAQLFEDGGPILESALFVRVSGWAAQPAGGYVLPSTLQVHSVLVERGRVWRFEQFPSLMLWMLRKQARINPPELDSTRFLPPD